MRGIFVTGTDTGIGKTHVACSLIRAFAGARRSCCRMKPVASGANRRRMVCAMQTRSICSPSAHTRGDYDLVNPYTFPNRSRTHLAAADAHTTIEPLRIRAPSSACGALGFCRDRRRRRLARALGDSLLQADIVRELDLRVLLVVGLRLGCSITPCSRRARSRRMARA